VKAPRNQHYVAQSYLRQFAIERAKHPRIYVFDKVRDHVYSATVRSVASEPYFYARNADFAQAIETTFGQLETAFAPAYRKLIAGAPPSGLTTDERAWVATYVAVQHLRTREAREALAGVSRVLRETVPEWDLPPGHEHEDAFVRHQQLESLGTLAERMTEILLNMKWTVCSNDTGRVFWTSDHPVALYNPLATDGIGSNLGLACRGIQVHFPLSPLRTLCFGDREYYRDLREAMTTTNEQHVVFHNNLMIQVSARFLFSNQANFALARDVLGEQPIYADPDRPRVGSA
jgi:hypothetical protein